MLRRCVFSSHLGSGKLPALSNVTSTISPSQIALFGRFFSSSNTSSGAMGVFAVPVSTTRRWCATSTPPPAAAVHEWKGSSTSSGTSAGAPGGGSDSNKGAGDVAADATGLTFPFAESYKNRSISRWLLVCAVWVSGVILVGAITRLTESGLSIVKWKPISGIKPPITPEEWEAEFNQYLQSVEGQQRGAEMSMDQFKQIFFWEWFHRVLARGIGVVFAVPLVYFAARGHLKQASPRFKYAGLGGLVVLGASQGALGWYMVKSGLNKNLLDAKTKATVSAYRLAAHLSLAFTILSTMLVMGFSLRVPALPAAAMKVKSAKMFKGATHAATALMFSTAVSGAFVAGLDAGLLYNDTFPWMGEGIIPPIEDLTNLTPMWKNLTENPSACQLFHRLMAGSTTVAIVALNVAGRRSGMLVTYPHIRRSLTLVNVLLVNQVMLGVGSLLTYVHTHVAATHQAGAMALLTSLLRLVVLLSSKGRVL